MVRQGVNTFLRHGAFEDGVTVVYNNDLDNSAGGIDPMNINTHGGWVYADGAAGNAGDDARVALAQVNAGRATAVAEVVCAICLGCCLLRADRSIIK